MEDDIICRENYLGFAVGDTIIHVNHGRGVITHIWPDTDMTVKFEREIWPGDDGVVIVMVQYCRKDLNHG